MGDFVAFHVRKNFFLSTVVYLRGKFLDTLALGKCFPINKRAVGYSIFLERTGASTFTDAQAFLALL